VAKIKAIIVEVEALERESMGIRGKRAGYWRVRGSYSRRHPRQNQAPPRPVKAYFNTNSVLILKFTQPSLNPDCGFSPKAD